MDFLISPFMLKMISFTVFGEAAIKAASTDSD